MNPDRLTIARTAALQAGNELVKIYQSGNQQGELKSDQTLVTEADRKADHLIQSLIRETCPQDGILSEESSTIYPEGEHAWVVDPLDGTVNFSHGLLYWGVSIAHLEHGQPADAAVYFPLVDELYTASLGQGAELNGKPLIVQEGTREELVPLFVHCSRMHQQYDIRTRFKKRSLGAAAYHICLVAKSTAALALESTPRIWDFAASWLIVKESGGAIKALGEEQPFPAQPGVDYAGRPFPILAARSVQVLEEQEAGITPRKRST
ncbi:MAG: inositol monophosphatase family protein [Anaerolineales bacterium]|jgi:myo-inositol-1(or 4)-monophosphatase